MRIGAWRMPGPARWARPVDALLRAVGQVFLQDNWAAGLVILAAIAYNSPPYAAACLVGGATATVAAAALGADKRAVGAGLYGFNGVLAAVGLAVVLGDGPDAWPTWRVWLLVFLAAAFTAVVSAALTALVGRTGMPFLTWPFNITAWLFVAATTGFAHLESGHGLAPALPGGFAGPAGPYTWRTLYRGVGNSIAEVFLQDNWISGYIILAALAISSATAAAMAAGGALAGIGVAALFGADPATAAAGLYGFNSVLTAIAIGGVFIALTWRGLAYAMFATVVTTFVWAALTAVLAPAGLPAFTGPFCIVATLAILAARRLPALKPAVAADPADRA